MANNIHCDVWMYLSGTCSNVAWTYGFFYDIWYLYKCVKWGHFITYLLSVHSFMHSSLYLMFIETHPPPEQKYDINEKMMEYRTFIFSYKANVSWHCIPSILYIITFYHPKQNETQLDKNMNKLMATKRKAHPYNLILFFGST